MEDEILPEHLVDIPEKLGRDRVQQVAVLLSAEQLFVLLVPEPSLRTNETRPH